MVEQISLTGHGVVRHALNETLLDTSGNLRGVPTQRSYRQMSNSLYDQTHVLVNAHIYRVVSRSVNSGGFTS